MLSHDRGMMQLWILQNMMYLMAWLALLNVGNIDWEEYIPMMYTRFLRTFKLPVHYKKMSSMKPSKMVDDKVASWIVSTLVIFSSELNSKSKLFEIYLSSATYVVFNSSKFCESRE